MLGSNFSFEARNRVVTGELARLARSLADDLDRLLPDEDVFIPPEKARMTRKGGRCERDGTFLEFDPRSPRRHRCPSCGTMFDAEEHYRWWIMGYQLWLSERAVHAAALSRLGAGERYGRLSEAILAQYCERYLAWPNADNVLGPTRVFFSTYLESIWLLQLSAAVLILEQGSATTVGDSFRERVALPSSALIRAFNEGLSNRQVWNSAALGATALLLSRPDQLQSVVHDAGGLCEFLQKGLLSDGSWYEGENYHLFAHRGLWYLVRLAAQGRIEVPDELLQRFADGFVAPLSTALPDFTFPSRRDSQYRASLRQWRVAESLELGLAHTPGSIELASGLTRLYGEGPTGDAQRWRSTGEAERNVPGVRLTRADLGWKSLLFALPELPAQKAIAPHSALMEGQGFGVIRRDEGRTFIALDYGHTGGGHGHPDRLNLWLVHGDSRVFEDVGTGSYVERTLHWYRSTLAHNAPLVDGRSQDPVAGSLRAWHDQGEFAWIDAEARIADGVLVRRSVVTGPGFIVDRVEWTSERDVTFDLPFHIDGDMAGPEWSKANLTGGTGLEDGFDFVHDAQTAPASSAVVQSGSVTGALHVVGDYSWWKARAPGPPGTPDRSFFLVRARGKAGQVTSVWSWGQDFRVALLAHDLIEVRAGGSWARHRFAGEVCHVKTEHGEFTLDGRRQAQEPNVRSTSFTQPTARRIPLLKRVMASVGELLSSGDGVRFVLDRSNYRRTDESWEKSGSPEATIAIAGTQHELVIEVDVVKRDPSFTQPGDENPLDNEHPDTNSDGVQIHLAFGTRRYASWLLVPETDSNRARVSHRDDALSIPLTAAWKRSRDGWQLQARIDRKELGSSIGLDVIVNEMPSTRERRRGQLVMSAKAPGWAYLRGDRQDIDQLIPMTFENV